MSLSVHQKEIVAACLMSSAGAIVYLISPVLVGSALLFAGPAYIGPNWGYSGIYGVEGGLIGALGAVIMVVLLLGRPELVRYSFAIVFLTLSINFWLAYMLGGVAAIDR